MTDLQKFIDLYKSFGIELKSKEIQDDIRRYPNAKTVITMWAEPGEVTGDFDGYTPFRSDVLFDENGKFIKQGFWE